MKLYFHHADSLLKGIALGIELIPCIQLLGHLATMLRWRAAAPYKDTANAMLAGAEETYALIEDLISKKLQALRGSHRAAWKLYHKSFGWEVHDIRYGGLIMRFDTVRETIRQYLAGEIEMIDTLEEERLRFDCLRTSQEHFLNDFLWNKYQAIATTGIL